LRVADPGYGNIPTKTPIPAREVLDMIEVVTWRSSLEEARIEAREQHKELLIDLFNPG